MSLSETQLSGLKKGVTGILEDDLQRVLTAIGLRMVPPAEPGTKHYQMRIIDQWNANAVASEIKSDSMKPNFRVDFFVSGEGGRKLGPTFRTDDANILQLKGAPIMAEMFESVDDLKPFTCPECEAPALSWDGALPSRTVKAGMVCGSCGYKGHTGTFIPLREYR